MSDFASAYEEGQNAAEIVKLAIEEIDSIFDELDKQILKKTDGKLSITRSILTKNSSYNFLLSWPLKPNEEYWAIIASNPKISENAWREIARWSQDKRGYPCRIIWEKEDRSCMDKNSLEGTLSDLLKDPLVAQELHKLIVLEPKVIEDKSSNSDESE